MLNQQKGSKPAGAHSKEAILELFPFELIERFYPDPPDPPVLFRKEAQNMAALCKPIIIIHFNALLFLQE